MERQSTAVINLFLLDYLAVIPLPSFLEIFGGVCAKLGNIYGHTYWSVDTTFFSEPDFHV